MKYVISFSSTKKIVDARYSSSLVFNTFKQAVKVFNNISWVFFGTNIIFGNKSVNKSQGYKLVNNQGLILTLSPILDNIGTGPVNIDYYNCVNQPIINNTEIEIVLITLKGTDKGWKHIGKIDLTGIYKTEL